MKKEKHQKNLKMYIWRVRDSTMFSFAETEDLARIDIIKKFGVTKEEIEDGPYYSTEQPIAYSQPFD